MSEEQMRERIRFLEIELEAVTRQRDETWAELQKARDTIQRITWGRDAWDRAAMSREAQ